VRTPHAQGAETKNMGTFPSHLPNCHNVKKKTTLFAPVKGENVQNYSINTNLKRSMLSSRHLIYQSRGFRP
jgi:hypothetical protein